MIGFVVTSLFVNMTLLCEGRKLKRVGKEQWRRFEGSLCWIQSMIWNGRLPSESSSVFSGKSSFRYLFMYGLYVLS